MFAKPKNLTHKNLRDKSDHKLKMKRISTPAKKVTKRAKTEKSSRKTSMVRRAPTLYRSLPNSAGGPWPLQKSCQLVYSDIVRLTLTTGRGIFSFSANGLYDPYITGTGHQPMYFDQLMAIYNHYVVTGARFELQAVDASADILCSVYQDDDTTQTNEAEYAAERPGASAVVIKTGQQSPLLTSWFSAYKTFGPNVLNNELFRGNSSANPTEQSYFAVSVFDPLLASDSYDFWVKITYTATFTELKTISGS